MPLYEYLCETCGRRTETLQRIDEPPLSACPHCGGALRRLVSAPSFQFKGSGWYATDYARKGDGASDSGEQAVEAPASAASEAAKADSGGSSEAPSAPPSSEKAD